MLMPPIRLISIDLSAILDFFDIFVLLRFEMYVSRQGNCGFMKEHFIFKEKTIVCTKESFVCRKERLAFLSDIVCINVVFWLMHSFVCLSLFLVFCQQTRSIF